MVKISIELDDIIKGEKLRLILINELNQKGLLLPERHAGLCLDDLAEIVSLSRTENQTQLKIKHDDIPYIAQIPEINDNILKAGLSCLYGYGHLKYNYNLPVFQNLAEEDIKKYMKLTLEIWERNIHKDWMRKCGYKTHNGTKDELFLYQMMTDINTAVVTHRERSDRREMGDTPHHIFRDQAIIEEIILEEGSHELTTYFIESFYDQATAPTRTWFGERELPFEDRHNKNRDLGYYINPNFRWKPGVFKFKKDYENKLWDLWLKVHDEFKEYWVEKFSRNEELWQPPTPPEILKK